MGDEDDGSVVVVAVLDNHLVELPPNPSSSLLLRDPTTEDIYFTALNQLGLFTTREQKK